MRLRRALAVTTLFSVALASCGLLAVAPVSAADAPGTLVLSVVGDGSAPLATTPTAVSLQSIATDGSALSTPIVRLPIAQDGTQYPFSLSGDSSAIGQLALAADGLSLAIAGYSAAPGAPIGDPKDSTAAAVPRLVASIAADGAVDTSTVLTGAYSADHPRSVATADGSSFYVSGNGTGKSPAAGVVLAQRGSTAAPVAIAASPINARNLAISGGQLFASSGAADRGVWTIGSGLPVSATAATRSIPATAGTAASLLLLDRDSTPGADTAYVNIEGTGIAKWSLVGSTWTAEGSTPGTFQAITGRVVDGVTRLFLVAGTAAGNTVIATSDTAGVAPIALGAQSVIATAAANTAYRGIAFAPTGWSPKAPAVPDDSHVTIAATTPASRTVLGGSLSTELELATDGDDDPATFAVEVTASSNPTVVTPDDVEVTGDGASRTLRATPAAVGRTVLTVTATNPANDSTATTTVTVAASALTPALRDVAYHDGSADASTAIAVGDDYMLVADDESNIIRLYDRDTSGPAVKEFDFTAQLGTKEIDLEASARVGDTIYWFASHGNNKDSEYKSARNLFFTTTVSGTGASTQLAFGATYAGLRNDLLAWDAANSNRLGLDVSCSLAGGTHPDTIAGCNIEGFEFAPGGTTGLIGFRAPRVGGKAVVVPVTNISSLAGSTVKPTFGNPILMDLGGRTIRELRRNDSGEYLITAGVPDDADQALGWALYRWNGVASSAPILVTKLPSTTGAAGQETGSYESIVEVPAVPGVGSDIQLLTDNGTTVFYGDGIAGKDVTPAALRTFRSLSVTLGDAGVPAAVASAARVVAGDPVTVTGVGFTPGETVTLDAAANTNTNTTTTTTTATASGEATIEFTVPLSTPAGELAISLAGVGSGLVESTTVSVSTPAVGAGTATISGKARVGSVLTAKTGSWSPAGTTFSYQWMRSGAPITGATGRTFTVGRTEAGKSVTVAITGTATDHSPVTKTSAAVKVEKIFTTTPKPRISGSAVVGRTLTAKPGSWSPRAKLRFTWLRDGNALSAGADGTYVVRSADRGHRLTLTVTGSKSGYTSVTKSSAATGRIR